ncbi:hypothetical protein [Amaricoccus macauensis]|uniref:hypothetical protein n=1 Tax=Amaricoccus macauensis TaxID=57001 RepID=UPI003C7DB939
MIREHMMLSAELRTRALVRSILWSLLALVAAIGGLGFLGAALWLWMEVHLGAVAASAILGCVSLLVALLAVAFASASRVRQPLPKAKIGVDDLAEAFLAAVELGRSARRRK